MKTMSTGFEVSAYATEGNESLPRLRFPRGRRCDGVSGLRRGVFRGRVDGIRMSRVQGLRARGRGCVSELRGALRRGNGLDECGPGNRSSARASANPGAIEADGHEDRLGPDPAGKAVSLGSPR